MAQRSRTMQQQIDPGAILDRTGTVRRPPAWRVLRETLSHFTYFPPLPDRADVPPGNDHVVLAIPGFLRKDRTTRELRAFLDRCGYRSFGWGLGVNWGPSPQLVAGLRRRLTQLCEREGGPVSVIGVSLGGLLARDLAHEAPDDVRQVITIASPISLPTASPVEPMIRLSARFYRPAIDVARLAVPLAIPSCAIFTRDDGTVAWETCRSNDPNCLNIEASGPHSSIQRNPDVLRAVAMRLGAV
jgi:pimeloyl-ACP methyl ester carboxylesterase